MTTARLVGIALLIVGVILLFFGFQSTGAVSEKIVEGVTGRYTDGTMTYLVGGAVAAAVGLGLVLFGKKRG